MNVLYNEIDPFAADWIERLIAAGHIAPGIVDRRSVVDLDPEYVAGFRQVHLFAGIGTWSRVARLAGFRDTDRLWTFSCPCQPFSTAGKGEGFDDERHLWPAVYHLLNYCEPEVIAAEQVASKDGLGWGDLVLDDLEAAGYAFVFQDRCGPVEGAPHIRQRLFGAGVRKDWLEHAKRERLEGLGWNGDFGDEPGWLRALKARSASASGEHGRLADAQHDEQRPRGGRGGAIGARAWADTGGRSGACGLAYSHSYGPERGEPSLEAGGGRRPSDAGREGGMVDTASGERQVWGRHEAQGYVRAELGSRYTIHPVGLANPNFVHADGAGSGAGHDSGRLRREDVVCGFADPDGLDDTVRVRLGSRGVGDNSGDVGVVVDADGGDDWSDATHGFWAAPDWLFCRDGKWRPVESGTFPLAAGTPRGMGSLSPRLRGLAEVAGLDGASLKRAKAYRMGALRGYGNGIIAPVALGFLEDFLASVEEYIDGA